MPSKQKAVKKTQQTKKIGVQSVEFDTSSDNHSQPTVARDFASMYQDSRGKLGSMSTIERKDPNRKKKIVAWIIITVVVLAGASVGGFFYFVNTQDSFSGDNISISIMRSPGVSSGESTGITITVTNDESIGLKNVELTVRYPSEFKINSASPLAINEANNAWKLGEIPAGASKTVEITGQLFGSVGSTFSFSSLLSYMPANFNSEFQMREDFTVTVSDSILTFDIEAPARVISEQSEQYSYTITNNSSERIDRIRFRLTVPEDLAISNFDPQPTDGSSTWEIAGLDADESYVVTFNGTISADEGSMREVEAELGYVDSDGTYHKQISETSIVFIVNPELTVKLAVDTESTSGTVPFGGTLDYTLTYDNASQSEIKNLLLSIEFNDTLLDWDSLVDTNEGTVNGNTIQWESDVIDSLEVFGPGDSGELTFSISLLDNIRVDDSGQKNYTVRATAHARSSEVVDLEGGTLEVDAEPVDVKVDSRLDLRAEGRYYSDEYIAVGDGPIPPVVGEKTTYQIYWYIQNNTNEVTDVTVTATLPKDVTWEGDSTISAGELTYNESTRVVTWSVNRVLEHVGQLTPELSGRIAVSITPAASDGGTLMTLLGKSTIRGYDTFTEHEVAEEEDFITSNLDSDPRAVGDGLVTTGSATNTNSNTNTSSNTNSTSSSNTNSTTNTNTAEAD